MPTASESLKTRPSSAALAVRNVSCKWGGRFTPELFHTPLSRDPTKKFFSWTKRGASATRQPRRPSTASLLRRGQHRNNRRVKSARLRRRVVERAKKMAPRSTDKPTQLATFALQEASSQEKTTKHLEGNLSFHQHDVEVRPVVGSGASGGIKNGQWHFLRAYQLRLRGDYLNAIKHYTSGLAYQEHDVRCLLNRGYCLSRVGRVERAAQDFKHAAEINPESPFASYNLGLALQKLHRHGESITALTAALKCFKRVPNTKRFSHRELRERRDFIEQNANLHANILYTRAMSYRFDSKFAEASHDYAELEALKEEHGLEKIHGCLKHKVSGGMEYYSTGPVYDLQKEHAEHEKLSLGIDQIKREGALSHLSEYFQNALASLKKPGESRDETDVKRLVDLTSNVACFRNLSKDSHRRLCRKMSCVNLEDGEVLFEEGEEGQLFYTIMLGKISLHSAGKVADDEVTAKVDQESGNVVTWETRWRAKEAGSGYHIMRMTPDKEKRLQYITTLHTGTSFGELALTNNAPRRATCVSHGKTVLLSLDRGSFEKEIKELQAEQIEEIWRFLRKVDMLKALSDDDLRSLAGIVEIEQHNCDSVLLAEGEEYHNLRIIKKGKCRVVKHLPIRNHHAVVSHGAGIESSTSPYAEKVKRRREQRRRSQANASMSASRRSQENKYSVSHDTDTTWEFRRAESVQEHLKLSKSKNNWNSNRHDAHHPDSSEAYAIENIQMDHAMVSQSIRRKSLLQSGKKNKAWRRKEPIDLCHLMPGDLIGEDNVLGAEDASTGEVKAVGNVAQASVVADTQVEVLILHRIDLYRRTNFSTRAKMRKHLLRQKGRSTSAMLFAPQQQLAQKAAWEKYRSNLVKGLNKIHIQRSNVLGR